MFYRIICILLLMEHSVVASNLSFMTPYNKLFEDTTGFTERGLFSFTQMGGFDAVAYNGNAKSVTGAQYLDATQNALAMVKGFAQGSEQAAIADQFGADGDDGVRGHFVVTGDTKIAATTLFSYERQFENGWWCAAALPFYRVKTEPIFWKDQTKSITADDFLAQDLLTNNIFSTVYRLGNGLELTSWDQSGWGDLTFLGGWHKKFIQYKQYIKEVIVAVQGGISLPTGKKKDEDKVFSVAFGHDGSVALIAGAALDINFNHWINAGIDVVFEHTFNNTRKRRIKTHQDQTELLLLAKTDVQKNFGFLETFTLYLKPTWRNAFTTTIGYQHTKRSDTTLYVLSNNYSSAVANSAESLKEATLHCLVAQIATLPISFEELNSHTTLALSYVHPFNGRRALATRQFGISLSFVF